MTTTEYNKNYNSTHKEKRAAYRAWMKENDMNYNATAKIRRYRQSDLQYNRGECTLTPEWFIEKIYHKSCVYCGETDWHKLGTDRIDNSKPHTPDNVVCCCKDCNQYRQRRDFVEYFRERYTEKVIQNS